ncbi:hypothetical protein [Stenotrophomonas oahuensis]|uniref:Uncharacterized protein n=1 Tax=Stenotrophomonas oahuensis TaxID=3003271 RepID=A0ABY9YTF8_9GAMM|nr:hypothetical protein [Stenotrophomonas sp. A5586]WNH54253.1 hypothetical protein PDM29_08250 [Stenotrophomonas sp. A5586]
MNATAATTSQPPRVMAAVTCLVLAVSYSISFLIAGHGVMPIGLALFMFADEATKGLEYPLTTGAVSAGWAGLAVLLLSLTCLGALRVHTLIRLVAALLLFASWQRFNGHRVQVLGALRAPSPGWGGCGHMSQWPAEILVNSIDRL